MKVAEKVTVYKDPITKKDPEGKARIVKVLGGDRYEVLFDYDDCYVERIIHE